MAKSLPVTAKNVGCELLDRLYKLALHDLWLINCDVKSTIEHSRFLYLYDKDLSCAPSILECLKPEVTTPSKCVDNTITVICDINIDVIPEVPCSTITVTEGIFAISTTSFPPQTI